MVQNKKNLLQSKITKDDFPEKAENVSYMNDFNPTLYRKNKVQKKNTKYKAKSENVNENFATNQKTVVQKPSKFSNIPRLIFLKPNNYIQQFPDNQSKINLAETFSQDPRILVKTVCQMRKFYGEVLKALLTLNKALNPSLLLQMTVLIICLVLNGYLVVQFIISNEENTMFFLSLTRLIAHASSVMYLLMSSENLNKTVSMNKKLTINLD